jgi:hypothetical protein
MKPIPTAPTSPLQTAEMSALPPIADIHQHGLHVRLVPITDMWLLSASTPRGPALEAPGVAPVVTATDLEL